MADGNTAFISYILIPTTGLAAGNYCRAIHCNYIKKIDLGTGDPYVQEIGLNFPNDDTMDIGKDRFVLQRESDFKFLADSATLLENPLGTGYTANKIHILIQIVNNASFDSFDDVKPDSTLWKQFDVTSQAGSTTYLTATQLTDVVFRISLLKYNDPAIFLPYNLDYLDYETGDLGFGEETYFFGNISTEIKADVYTTDISINLPLNEFNSSTNKTWDGIETIYISEIGIYDSNKNLVAIGKLNNPVAKDGTIARTIVFALDF